MCSSSFETTYSPVDPELHSIKLFPRNSGSGSGELCSLSGFRELCSVSGLESCAPGVGRNEAANPLDL